MLFRVYKLDAFTENGAFVPIFVLLYGFGLCVTGFTYCLSYLFSSHTRGQVITVVLNLRATPPRLLLRLRLRLISDTSTWVFLRLGIHILRFYMQNVLVYQRVSRRK